jgi:hypothetical protein
MTTLQERIANERRRLRTIRQNMVAAVEKKSKGDESFIPFYIASADYIDATMLRLHEQDVKMGDMIREKADAVEDDIETAMGQLEARLEGAKAHLKPFLEARDELKEKGAEALEHFEKVAKEYSDFIVANMGHHDATSDLSAKLFSMADWEYMAGITDEQLSEEENLFERAAASTPDSLKHITD